MRAWGACGPSSILGSPTLKMDFNSLESSNLLKLIKSGGVGVLPTDTIYGIVASANNKKSIERIYKLKERNKEKPFIILVSSFKDLENLGVETDNKAVETLKKYWPGKVSVVLPIKDSSLEYLHRGKNSLAFRLPDYPELTKLIKETGPLVAPSANPEGMEPAKTIDKAKKYFGDNLDFYVDAGKIEGSASTLISIKEGKVNLLRQGEAKV